jgi:hypothetical protein
LRVDRETFPFLVPSITFLHIPAVGGGETLIVRVALGVVVVRKGTNRLVRPRLLWLTVQPRMAVAVLRAIFTEKKTLADAAIAIL